MGQPVTVLEKPSVVPGVVRFETNRPLAGTGTDVFRSVDDAVADRPVDEVARILFGSGAVDTVSVCANVVTVQLRSGASSAGLRERLEELFIHYREGVEVVQP